MTRLMFAAAGVKYEDERIKWEDWPKLKTGRQRLYLGGGTERIIIFCWANCIVLLVSSSAFGCK